MSDITDADRERARRWLKHWMLYGYGKYTEEPRESLAAEFAAVRGDGDERRVSAMRSLRETLEARDVVVPAAYGFNDVLTLYAKTLDDVRGEGEEERKAFLLRLSENDEEISDPRERLERIARTQLQDCVDAMELLQGWADAEQENYEEGFDVWKKRYKATLAFLAERKGGGE